MAMLSSIFSSLKASTTIIKLNNNISAKLSNDYIYNLILDGVNNTNTLSEELKIKVINKAYEYKQDISNYVYDIEVKLIEGDK